MQFQTNKPNIKDMPAFMRGMASALAEMHAEPRAHGALGGSINNWLNDEQDTFHAERFKEYAMQSAMAVDLPTAMHQDVGRFVERSIEWIQGPNAARDQSFQPSLYADIGLPNAFLCLLQKVQLNEPGAGVTMSELSQALEPQAAAIAHEAAPGPPSAAPEAALETVAASVPKVAPKPVLAAPTPTIIISLRNATVGKPYQVEAGAIAAAIAKQRGDNPEQARISHLQLPVNCGLVFDEASGAVMGTPRCVFDGSLTLDYVPARSASSLPFKVSFLINPDPLSLWKDLPPPTDAPYQKPICDHAETRLGPFRVVAASRRGRSHANKGEFRDDDFAIGYAADTGWLVVVAADGAGSATYSRRGSQIACATAKERLVAGLNSAQHNTAEALYAQHRDWQHVEVRTALRQTLYDAALVAHHKLRAEVTQPAETLPTTPTLRNYDTTLILLLMKRTGEGCVAATFAIGDGGAGLLAHAGEGFPITQPEGGEYAGQTYFLTMPETLKNDEANLERHFELKVTAEFCAALVMTDGITDPKFPSDAAFADPAQWGAFWGELQPVLGSSQALLEWMNFFSPGNHDDRTLIAVMPA